MEEDSGEEGDEGDTGDEGDEEDEKASLFCPVDMCRKLLFSSSMFVRPGASTGGRFMMEKIKRKQRGTEERPQ